jgi:hypothetical protein
VYPPNARLPAFSTFPGVCECRPLFARIFAPQEALIALGYSRGKWDADGDVRCIFGKYAESV